MQRRSFLSAGVAGMVAAGVAPRAITAQDKNDAKRPVVGVGAHRYECIHDWAKAPANFRWETTHGVCVDAAGLVYIKQQGHGGNVAPRDTVHVFDAEGRFVRSFGKAYYPGGHGIDIRTEGRTQYLYLCDVHNRQVIKTTLSGEEVWKLCFPVEAGKYTRVRQFSPTNVAFGAAGGFYVADGYGSNFIHQYDRDAKWVRTWGGSGDKPGLMRTPHGIWMDDRPGGTASLVVADRANARLQYFTPEGRHLSMVRDVLFPAHFDIRGEVLMVADLHARVSLFDKDNKVITHLGDDPDHRKLALAQDKGGFVMRRTPERCPAGKFVHPHDACFDADGNIFVVEWVHTGRVTKLRKIA